MALFNRQKKIEEELKHPDRVQSAPLSADVIRQMQMQRMASGQGISQSGALDGFKALEQVIGREQVQDAMFTLNKYKEGKSNLEQKIVDNEQWYKLRNWECMRDKGQEVQPTSAWLFNAIATKHSDCMDSFPRPNVLPREEGDQEEADSLSSILPVILDQNEFEETYSDVQSYKLKTGAGVYGVFWNGTKLNGLGDVEIKKIDLISLFWESGVTDIQKSRNVFHVELADNDVLVEQYPQLKDKLGGKTIEVTKYIYDDTVDTSNKSAIIDWYYKKSVNGKAVLHYCKFVNDIVLFATENDPNFADRGWYDHGLYPFIVDPLYKIEGTIAGFGIIDIAKDTQSYIDRANQAIMKNLLANAAPRHFIRMDGVVNEDEYTDLSRDLVHVDGNLGQDSIMPIQGKPLSDVYVNLMLNKVDELKEVTGNRDSSNGGTSGGVTSASGLAAQIEAGSKLSRDINKGSYRAYRKLCLMVIELIRQFYDMPRKFRIMGENGAAKFISYQNAGIQPQPQFDEFGEDMGYRLPLFDIEISAERQSPYSRIAQNDLAIQFYNAGFFNPQLADQALAALDMMDFDRKNFVMKKIAENGTMYQMLMQAQQQVVQLASVIDGQNGTNYAEQFAMQMAAGQPMTANGGAMPGGAQTEALGAEAKEPSHMRKAKQRVAESTSPT